MNARDVAPEFIPAHIPRELVFDFDYMDDIRFKKDLHDGVLSLVEQAPPIFYTPRYGGHWVATTPQAIQDITRNTGLFSSRKGTIGGEQGAFLIPVNSDPPQHATFRQPLALAFSPKTVSTMEGAIREFVNQLIDRTIDRGHCDFLKDIAEPLPVTIFMKLMGLPLDRLEEFRVWATRSMGTSDPEERKNYFTQIITAMSEIIVKRQAKREDDLISRLLDVRVGDRPPTFEEMQNYCLLLFIAGLDTVVNAMSFGIRHLAQDQQLQASLRADPALIPDAIEELLRRYAIAIPCREVTREDTYAGIGFKEGDMVMLLLHAANLDAKTFASPDKVDLDRSNTGAHFTFGAGPHRCVGSHLARLELKVLYQEWLRRVPTFKLDPEHPAHFHAGLIFTVMSLPLVWNRN